VRLLAVGRSPPSADTAVATSELLFAAAHTLLVGLVQSARFIFYHKRSLSGTRLLPVGCPPSSLLYFSCRSFLDVGTAIAAASCSNSKSVDGASSN